MTSPINPEALLPLIQRIADQTRCDDPPSAAVTCKSEVAILPLRYAVLTGPADDALQALTPDLPDHLGAGLPALQDPHARYGVRTMRRGYLYVFTKRLNKDWFCESAYRTFDSGLLKRVLPYAHHHDAPPDHPLFENRPNTYDLHGPAESGPGGWTLRLKAPEDIEALRVLFTPDPLTENILNKICTSSRLRDTLQLFNIRQLMMSCSRAPDVVDPVILDDTVADAIAHDQPQHADTLAGQLYSSAETRYAPHLIAADLKATSRRARGFGIVLHDPIAITQQLNSWRNEAYEALQQYLDLKDEHGIQNERHVLVAQAFIDVKKQFEARTAALEAQHYIDVERARVFNAGMATGRNWILKDEEREQWDQQADHYLTAFEDTMRARVQSKLDSGEYRRRFDNKYLSPAQPGQAVRVADMERELTAFDAVSATAEAIGQQRAQDHERWLTSDQLLTALDVYDDKDWVSGWHFAGQTGLCILGADGCSSTSELISQWWQGNPTERANLAMRGFALNQQAIQAELQRTLDSARATPHVPVLNVDQLLLQAKSGLETVHQLADLFDKANGIYEELAAAGDTNLAGGALAWYSSLGRQTLRRGPAGMEWFFHGLTRNWLAASIGTRAAKLRLEDLEKLGRSADPRQLRTQIGRNTQFAFATELVDARRSDFYKVRAGSWLLLFEAALISLRMRDMPEDARGYGELMAHLLLAGAAGTEMLAAGTELVLGHYSRASATGLGATMFFGQLKLAGGALAAVGGLVIASYDVKDARTADSRDRIILAGAYRLRVVATFAMVASQSSLAFAAAGPMFRIMAERAIKGKAKHRVLNVAVSASTFLGRSVVLTFLRNLLLRSSLIGAAATLAICILDDDALQSWCMRCAYRGTDYQSNTPFKDTAHELAALYSALQEVL